MFVYTKRSFTPFFPILHTLLLSPVGQKISLSMNKTKNILIRVNLFDEKLIKVKAKDCGLSVSEYLRRCGLNKSVPKSMNTEELEVYKDLKKFYNNFTSISNLLVKGDHARMIQEIEELKSSLKEHLKKITDDKQSKIS